MKAISRFIALIGVSALFLLGVGYTIEHTPNLIISIVIIIALAILSSVLLWISGLHEERLEDELNAMEDKRTWSSDRITELENALTKALIIKGELEMDFANQVAATDEAEGRATHWKRKYDELNALDTLPTQALTNVGIYPFNSDNADTTEIHQCTKCDNDKPLRETKCYYICDYCKSRYKKEVK